MTSVLENKTFDEIKVGDTATVSRALREEDIETLAALSGNINLDVFDQPMEGRATFMRGSGEAIWAAALFASVAGTKLPGLGSVVRSMKVISCRPVPEGVHVMATITVTGKHAQTGTLDLACRGTDPSGEEVMTGTAVVVAPTEKIHKAMPELPEVELVRKHRYLELIAMCEGLEALTTAVVHPCSADALKGAVEAAERNLIVPIFVGPEDRIRSIAVQEAVDLAPYRIVPAEHSHHAAEVGVDLVRSGEAFTLMKGSLHTDELLRAVLHRDAGIRTERRLSHCFLLAVPTRERAFVLTDAAINISPDLMTKRDICQNAIDLAHAVGIERPRVAILAAVETVNPGMPATLDAAALCKMANRGQITGALVDGPLAFDNAVDETAARTKGIVSPVAGQADILVAPDLEAGNMLAKQLTYLAEAEGAGVIVGARVPIILTSRADNARTRLASCALAVLMANAQLKGKAMHKVAEIA
jgi:phosphotransacetylase/acyl dehydratase